MRFGFIGTGRIASDLVEGLCAGAPVGDTIHLSPRNRTVSAQLASVFDCVTVQPDNQAVVDSSDVVFLSVLPSAAPEVLRGLRFSRDHLLISIVATFPLERARSLASPATVVRAVPLPSAKRRQSPTLLYPDNPTAMSVLSRLGRPVVLENEDQFGVAAAVTGLIKPVYVMLSEVSHWMAAHGIPEKVAARFVADQFHSMLALAAEPGSPGLKVLGDGAATPGGLNHQATEFLREAGTLTDLADALDAVLGRIVRQTAEG